MSNFEEWAEALGYRQRYRGVIGVAAKVPIKDRSVLSLVYTPGVAEPCLDIAKEPDASFDLTSRGNTVAATSWITGRWPAVSAIASRGRTSPELIPIPNGSSHFSIRARMSGPNILPGTARCWSAGHRRAAPRFRPSVSIAPMPWPCATS